MTLTARQQAIRAQHLTASEIPALFGVDPYRSAADLWLIKTGQLEPSESGEAAEIGHMLEPGLLDWAEREIGSPLSRRNALRVHPDGIVSCTYDALVVGKPECVQAKTTGILNPLADKEEWGDAGTDQVPERVIMQVQAEMAVTNLRVAWVPVLIGGRGRFLYKVERHDNIIKEILGEAESFWRVNVEKGVPPAGIPRLETLARVRRAEGKCVAVDDDLAELWLKLDAEAKAADDARDTVKAQILNAMGDGEVAIFTRGQFTYKQQDGRTSIDGAALMRELPDVAAKFTKQGKPFRVLRTKLSK